MNKKSIKLIMLVECLILLLILSVILLRKGRVHESIDIKYNEWYSDYVELENGEWSVKEDPERFDTSISFDEWRSKYIKATNGIWTVAEDLEKLEKNFSLVKSPTLFLEKGSYTITIWYQGTASQKMILYAYTNEDYIKANDIILDKNRNVVSCHFQLTEDIENLEFKLKYNGKGDFSLQNVAVERNEDNIRKGMVIFVGLLLCIDFMIYFHYASEERRKHLLILIGMVVLTSLPLGYKGIYGEGHDLKFHLMRIEGIVQELRNGVFPVRMSSAWMGGHGYPVSIYYGDFLLYIPAALRLLGFSITEAYKIFVFVINTGAVLIAEKCFEKIFKKKNLSLLLTLIYVTASYRLVAVYVRTAVGEYTSLIFLPLIALSIYNIYSNELNKTLRDNFINGTIMAIGMTGILTAHILTAEMTVLALALICLICFKKTIKWTSIRTYLFAVAETIIFSAIFLVPFVDYYLTQSVNISSIVKGNVARTIQDKGANIGDFFAFFNNPFGDWHTMLFNPGIVLMATLIVSIVLWSLRKVTKRMKVVTVLSGIMLILSTNIFPWDDLAHDWKIFDLIAQVQFPWRYVGLAIIFLTILLGFVLEDADLEISSYIQGKRIVSWAIALAVGMTCLFVSFYADNASREIWYDTENLGTYQVMGAEYARTGTELSDFTGKITGEGIVRAEIVSRQGCSINFYCEVGESGSVVTLPVVNYKGYKVTDDTGKNYAITDGENNLICFELPADYCGNLYLDYENPWYWNVATVVSIIGLVACTSVMAVIYRKNKL